MDVNEQRSKFISVHTEFQNYYINTNGNRYKSNHTIQTFKTEKVCTVVSHFIETCQSKN
jgi:hypothetical protein